MFNALAVVTTTVVGIMVGVEFAVAVFVNPMLLQLAVVPASRPAPGAAVSSAGSCRTGTSRR